MKAATIIALTLLAGKTIFGQLTITPGAQLVLSGNAQFTMQDMNLVNNGSLTVGNGIVSFTGNTSSSISGSQPVQFYELAINKTTGSSVSLQRMIGITQQISFTAGFLDLNGYDADLGSTALLNGEQENSRVLGSSGGHVLFSAALNNPVGVNPGNLGAIITSGQNLGNVVIRRGHSSQVNSSGGGNSIFRYYDIMPTNNIALNATLRFSYFDGELNGLTENGLVMWKSSDNTHWSSEGLTSRNTTTNYVEKTGISSFSLWTLSSSNNALPVQFTLLNLKCDGNKTVIIWKTAQELNSSHYNIERSVNGIQWTVIGNLPAEGNSSTESSYSFTDNHPVQGRYYRIAQYDIDGRVHYTSILRSSCTTEPGFIIWPNPVNGKLFVTITSNIQSPVMIKLFDNKGALIKRQREIILPGNNQLSVDMSGLANGMYRLLLEGGDSRIKKTIAVIKN